MKQKGKIKYCDIFVGAFIGFIFSTLGMFISIYFDNIDKNRNTTYSIYEELVRNKLIFELTSRTKDYVPFETQAWEASKNNWYQIKLPSTLKSQVSSCYTFISYYNARIMHEDRNKEKLEGNLMYLKNMMCETIKKLEQEQY